MDANEIRAFVNKEVNPPAPGKAMELTKELSGEIASSTPFWAALLRNRDIRSADGGDEYITGLIETFGRIFTVLKNHGAQGILSKLDLDTLYNLDAQLQENDLGLCDEYPALEMANVKGMDSFGAGVLMAYALFETALAIDGSPSTHRPAGDPSVAAEAVSLADELLAGLPSETSNNVVAPSATHPAHDLTNQQGLSAVDEMAAPLPAPPPGVAQPLGRTREALPFMVLGFYQGANGVLVRGDLPSTLGGAAQAYQVVQTVFGVDAGIQHGVRGLEFTFALPQKGGNA